MRCKRICRELLWLARFGEFGPSSAPHLDHLAGCSGCRDEVGFDRALVQQLRVTLAERIANEEPSPGAWSVILARAQAAPERGFAEFLRVHGIALASRLRTATAVTAVALAGVIATTTPVAISHPEAGSAETEVRPGSDGEQFELQPLLPRPRQTATPVVYAVAAAPRDPEVAFLINASLPAAATAPSTDTKADDDTATESIVVIGAPFSRLTPADPADSIDDPPSAPPLAARDDAPAGEPY
jgi:hypothetical protein